MNIEEKLRKYQGYVQNSVGRWKSQLNISEESIGKILKYLEIFSSRDIRGILRKVVNQNKKLIENDNCYICKFGPTGKSGDILLYEFFHTFKKYKRKLKETWEIPQLSESSKIVFIDDLVGTGTQSVRYIDKLSQLLNPSHTGYLLCLCATPQGIKKIKENTTISVIAGIILKEDTYQHLNDKCNNFDNTEKNFLRDLNAMLQDPDRGYYANLGLLLAFYFTVPNNTLPFIWKDKADYLDLSGLRRKWRALLPREY